MLKVGLYAIISPSGKVYIGQSYNINRRFREYKSAGGFRWIEMN